MRLASVEGLGALTIGRLATELGISKSGVYAHFRSKERLQMETINAARAIFQQEVLAPGLAAPDGRARLESLSEAFLSYVERGVFPGGCFFAQMLGEFDAQTGVIHDAVAGDNRGWFSLLEEAAAAAVARGEFDPGTDLKQLAFELTAALEVSNYLSVLHRDPSMIAHGRRAVQGILSRASESGPGRRA